ncbi:Protein MAK10-like protein [Aphelenchoides besseyi]|nr:Protein MAK10-like protein [Aphelenchoides besseyi]
MSDNRADSSNRKPTANDKRKDRFEKLREVQSRPEREITTEFFSKVKELGRGEMVMSPKYSLLDAMTAVEIMDPKMDSGMVRADPELGLHVGLKSGRVKQKLSITELLATVDSTLATIAAWLRDAQPLDQTVFINVWMHNPESIIDPVHRALTLSACYFMQLFRYTINMAACFNEEDFVSVMSFEPPVITSTAIQATLRSAEDIVIARVKSKQNKQENTALLHRIRFYTNVFNVFDLLIPPLDDTTAPRSPDSPSPKFSPQLASARAALKQSLHFLQLSKDTVRFGRQPTNGEDGDFTWLAWFQPKVNVQLLPPTFPREIKWMARSESYDFFLDQFTTILRMVEEAPPVDYLVSLEPILDYVEKYLFTSIICRSVLQLLILPTDDCLFGSRALLEVVTVSLSEFAHSQPISTLHRHLLRVAPDAASDLNDYLMEVVHAFLTTFQAFGQNPTRMHNKQLPEAVDFFGHLRSKGAALEETLRETLKTTQEWPGTFMAFCDFYGCKLVALHFDLGFRMDLYVDYELPYLFWILGDAVYRRLSICCSRRTRVVTYELAALISRPNSSEQLLTREHERVVRESLNEYTLRLDLSIAYFMLFSALFDDQKLRKPQGDEEARFWCRMYPASDLFSPMELSYERYCEYFDRVRDDGDPPRTMKDWTPTTRYETAIKYFKKAEDTLLQNKMTKEGVLRAIKSSKLAANMFAKKLDVGKKVTVDFSLGPHLPTLSIK